MVVAWPTFKETLGGELGGIFSWTLASVRRRVAKKSCRVRQKRTSAGFLLGFLLNYLQVGRVPYVICLFEPREIREIRATFERKVPSPREYDSSTSSTRFGTWPRLSRVYIIDGLHHRNGIIRVNNRIDTYLPLFPHTLRKQNIYI